MEGGDGATAGGRLGENTGTAGTTGRIADTVNRSERRSSGSTAWLGTTAGAGRGASVVGAADRLGEKNRAAGATEGIAATAICSERGSLDSTVWCGTTAAAGCTVSDVGAVGRWRGAGMDSRRGVTADVGTAWLFSGIESGGALIAGCNTFSFIDGSWSVGWGGWRG
jgi:hypothetical protein